MSDALSVVLPILNVGDILGDCLETVKWSNEIICVDMKSIDRTLEICKKYKTVILSNIPKDNNFDKNRKIGLQKAKGEWILKLDSDERLTKTTQDSIKKILKEDDKKINGYRIKNRTFFFNKEIKHGFWSRKPSELRLFRRKKWKYNPRKFHQPIEVKGKVKMLEGFYLHFNSQSIFDFIKKINIYSNLDSKVDHKKRGDINFFYAVFSPVYVFFKLYILNLGFLDGTYGLIVRILYTIYSFIYKIKIWERKK